VALTAVVATGLLRAQPCREWQSSKGRHPASAENSLRRGRQAFWRLSRRRAQRLCLRRGGAHPGRWRAVADSAARREPV